MRKFIKILLLILLILAIILGVSWFISRRTAEKNGTKPPTFREFLNWGTKSPTTTTQGGDLSSVFVDDNITSGDSQNTVTNTPGVLVSQFTNPSTNPTQGSNNNNGAGIAGSSIDPVNTPSPGIDPTTATPPAQVPPIIPGPECSDADLNIRFTPDELAELQVLQNRFYAISQGIHSDGDVATETGNWSNFKSKYLKFSELYNTCLAKTVNPPTPSSPVITSAQYKIRLPTPFWHETDPKFGEKEVFLAGPGAVEGVIYPLAEAQITPFSDYTKPLVPGPIMPTTISANSITSNVVNAAAVHVQTDANINNRILFAMRTLERSLRINLW